MPSSSQSQSLVNRILALTEQECVTAQAAPQSASLSHTYALRVEDIHTTPYEYCVYASAEDGGDYVLRLSRPTETADWNYPVLASLESPYSAELTDLK